MTQRLTTLSKLALFCPSLLSSRLIAVAVCVVLHWPIVPRALAQADPRPNIVLFVTDDQSQDIGAYGNDAIRTPNMDRLAQEGVIFRNAFCTTASCSASRSVILTGLHNHLNGHYGHQHSYHHFSAFDRVRSLPVRLTEAGYATIRIGKYHVAPEEVFKFETTLNGNARNPVQMANQVRAHLQEVDRAQPFFLYFCTSDPHRSGGRREDLPHRPNPFGNRPEGYEGVASEYYDPAKVVVPNFLPDTPVSRAELAMYYESISRIDAGLGQLVDNLKAMGEYDNTVIIFTSDHGMAFPGAKTTLYEPGMRVPMIVKTPETAQTTPAEATNAAQRENGAYLSHVDLAPTILDFAQAYGQPNNARKDFHGRSWAKVLNAKQVPKEWNTVYASHTFHEIQMYYPMRVVHTDRYKLIWNIAYQLPYPFASDLWAAPTWQDRYEKGDDTLYGKRTVNQYIHRAQFELFDLANDPDETRNLALEEDYADLLNNMKADLKQFQRQTKDPWISKWEYE